MECGVDPVRFWDMTYGEIITQIKAYRQKEKVQMQLQAMFIYKLGSLVGIAFNDPKKYPSNVKQAFKEMGIFDEDINITKQQDWRIMKERMNRYAYLHRKRGENR